MDVVLAEAINAVPLDNSSVERWFSLLCTVFAESDRSDWDAFAAALTEAAGNDFGSDAVRTFTETLEYRGKLDTVAAMANLGVNELTQTYLEIQSYLAQQEQAAAEPAQQEPAAGQQVAAQEAAAEPGYDEAAWQAFLQTNGVRWNGTDEAWEQFTAWFVYQAQESGVGQPANSLIDYLKQYPDSQSRIAVFASYGVTIAPPPGAAADPTAYDEAAWQAFLQTNGVRWNGTDEAWEQFVTWFRYQADQSSLGYPANGLITFLEQYPDAAGKIAAFANYGVTIAAAPAVTEPEAAEPAAVEPEAGVQQPPVDAQELAEAAGVEITEQEAEAVNELIPDIQEVLDDFPGIEEFTPEEIQEAINEALAQVAAESSNQ